MGNATSATMTERMRINGYVRNATEWYRAIQRSVVEIIRRRYVHNAVRLKP